MAEANQFTVTHAKLIELLIKDANVHDGVWSLVINFQVGVGKYGPSPNEMLPGVAVSVGPIGIQRSQPGEPTTGPSVVVVDAAKVNPAPRGKKE